LQRPGHLVVRPEVQPPFAVVFDSFEEAVGDAHGVVRVLAADGVVGFAVEVVIELELELSRGFLLFL
jgi:hypothetical protein